MTAPAEVTDPLGSPAERWSPARSRPSAGLTIGAAVVAAAFALPSLYVLWRVITLDADLAATATDTVGPTWRTLQLAVTVSISTALVGTGLAWLVVRTDVPLRRLWRVLAPLPLVFPSFVGAAAFLAAFGPDGILRMALDAIGVWSPDRIRGLGAAWFVLTVFTYPYVYLPVAARLSGLPGSLEDSARLLGDSPWGAFRRVVLPQIRPSIAAGTLLVFLYALSDFGAVQLLGYDTLTREIFANRLFDRARSFSSALVLVVVAIAVVAVERRISRKAPEIPGGERPAGPMPLGRLRWPALLLVASVAAISLAGPVVSLGRWAVRGDEIPLADLAGPAWSSAWVSVTAAVVAVAVVLPVAWLTVRHRSWFAATVNAAVVAGFAVPGLVIALALVFWSLNTPAVDWLYQSAPLLVMGYVVHFGSQAMRAAQVAVTATPEGLRDAGRLLGAGRVRRFVTIELPLMRPGLLAGGGLVMLSTIKELPATLLLSPLGFETLTTRIWGAYEDGFLARAGTASLALLALSGLLTWALVLRRSETLEG